MYLVAVVLLNVQPSPLVDAVDPRFWPCIVTEAARETLLVEPIIKDTINGPPIKYN